MNAVKPILWFFIGFIVCVAFGAWTTFDYGLQCTKCLVDKHVVEQHLFGITISRRTEDRDSGADYERVFGHPCQHVFRKGGFGRGSHSLFGSSIGCGITGEGAFVRPRLEAVAATYDAENRLHNHALTVATFGLIDTLMPPEIKMQQRRDLPETAQSTTILLGSFLRRAKTVEQWRAVLDAARKNFMDTSNLPTE
jgi:hypothetical protein